MLFRSSGGKLEIRAGAVLEAGEPILFASGEIEGELRCPLARFNGPLRVGPQGAVIAEKLSFTELTVEPGGKIRAWAEMAGVEGTRSVTPVLR
mgnify:CR=1 FL=1